MSSFFDPNSSGAVVLDTSAIINLAGSGMGEDILSRLPYEFLTTEIIRNELLEGRMRGWNHSRIFESMVQTSLISIQNIMGDSEDTFESLVIGKGENTLDDGEASALAIASPLSAFTVIDENKAMRISRERFPQIRLISSCDLFRHSAIASTLTRSELKQAVLSALSDSRMRVLEHNRQWVFDTIGMKNVANCTSLPKGIRKEASSYTLRL